MSRTVLYLNAPCAGEGAAPGRARTLWSPAKVNCRRCQVSVPLGLGWSAEEGGGGVPGEVPVDKRARPADLLLKAAAGQ